MDGVVGRGTLLAGRYRTLEPLDSDLAGASSWDATDQILDRPVRVTVLHSGHVPQALDAARRAALVTDPRLVRVLDVGEHEGVAYTVCEQVTGPSLGELVARGPLPADQARAIVGEAAAALEAARRRGVHHLTLRPSVLHLTPDDRVLVTGLAVDAALLGHETGDATAATRTDTLGLVALLYAALTGRWPATVAPGVRGGRSGSGLDAAPVLEGAPVPPAELTSGVPNDLDTLCAVTLGVHDDGPRTPAELVQELEPWGDIRATDLFAVTQPLPTAGSSPRRPPSPARGTPSAPARVQRTSVRSAFAGQGASVASRPGTPPPATPTRSSAFTGPAVGAVAAAAAAAGSRPAAAGTTAAGGASAATGHPAPETAPTTVTPARASQPAAGPDTAPTTATPAPAASPARAADAAPTAAIPVRPADTAPASALADAPARPTSPASTPASTGGSTSVATQPVAGPASQAAPARPAPSATATPTARPSAPTAASAPSSPAEHSRPAGTATTTARTATGTGATTVAAGSADGSGLLPLGPRAGGLDVASARDSIAAHRFDPTRFVLLLVGLVIVLGLFLAYRSLTSPVGPPAAEEPPPAATEPAPEPAPEEPAPAEPAPEEPAPAAPPVIASAAQLDPPPDGDDNEHPEAVPLAIDGDPATVWYTRTYSTSTYGGLKTGVGYAVTLAEPATVSTVGLQVRGTGGRVEVRATDPSTPTEGEVLASGPLGPDTTLTLTRPTETQNVVLWFTELPQTQDGSNRVELAEITLS